VLTSPPGKRLREGSALRSPPTENLRFSRPELATGQPDGDRFHAEVGGLLVSTIHPLPGDRLTPSCRLPRKRWHRPRAQMALWENATMGKDATTGMTFASGQVYVLPKKFDEKVARLHRKKVGVKLSVLSKAQTDCLGVPVEGPYKPDHYRY